MSLATLGMYDLPEFRDATDGWWEVLARAFEEEGVEGVPPELRRGEDSYHKAWTDPRLLFSQTCGYPLRLMLKDKVRYLATPCYSAPGCSGAYYRSAIVVRKDSDCTEVEGLRGKVCAYNSQSSQSGYNCLRAKIAPHAEKGRFFSRTVQSGGHHESLQLVATGKASSTSRPEMRSFLRCRCASGSERAEARPRRSLAISSSLAWPLVM